MSRIPRCNVSVTASKLPSLVASTPLVGSTRANKAPTSKPVAIAPNELKFSDNSAELSIIENVKPHPPPLKRSATVLVNHRQHQQQPPAKKAARAAAPPSKGLSSSTATTANATSAANSKLKHDRLQVEHGRVLEERDEARRRLEKLAAELEEMREEREKTADRCSRLETQVQELTDERKKLHSDVDSARASRDDALRQIDDLTREKRHAASETASLALQTELKQKENDSLKLLLDAEVKRNLEFAAAASEAQAKVTSQLGEIALLNIRSTNLQERNDENQKTINALKAENEQMKTKLAAVDSAKSRLSEDLDEKNRELDTLSKSHDAEVQKSLSLTAEMQLLHSKIATYTSELFDAKKSNEFLSGENDKQSRTIQEFTAKNEELQKKLEIMFENEKAMRNSIQDLKGHIRVYCRIRPSLPSESAKPTVGIKMLDSTSMELEKLLLNSQTNLTKKQNFIHHFAFDGIFNQSARQSDVFEEVSTMIQSALDGYNVCIFAYGQTGSGKTYTMEGERSSEGHLAGIVPRAIEMIFENIPKLRQVGWEFTVSASFLEIYNECIYDLLDSSKDQDHSIKMTDSKGTDVYVSNLKEETVGDAGALMKLLGISQKNRKTAATLSNERSSRSHSIAKIKFTGVHEAKNEKFASNLNFVDLAGSESGKNSQRMDETKSINKSLSELSKVILALQAKQSHIPYRNSKLTHLLMPSLGGNSKTLMLINVSQLDECYQETVNSLRFATTVNSCKNGVSKKNVSTL